MTVLQRIPALECGCDARSDLISIDEALRRISDRTAAVNGTEPVVLAQAQGRVLAEPVAARSMAPPFDDAAMDGYAVDTSALRGDGPWLLTVTDRVPAGTAAAAAVTTGTATRIFTGAPLPAGADAVVMQEAVHRTGDRIRLTHRPCPGLNIRRAGEDMAAGATVVAPGAVLGPAEIAACAAAGAGSIRAHRRVRAGVLITGSEVRGAGDTLNDAHIWDINTPMLAAALTRPGVGIEVTERGDDTRAGLRSQLRQISARVDLLVTTGGVSVGEEDHVKAAFEDLGGVIDFSGVAVKPGKPVSFGRLGDTRWIGLPGNPLAAFVTWQLFGAALLRCLAGAHPSAPVQRHVVTCRDIRRNPGRCELRPATCTGHDPQGREIADFADAVHSGRVAALPAADGLIVVPAEIAELSAGSLLAFRPFDRD